MLKNRKMLLAIVSILVLSLSLVGCGKGTTGGSSGENTLTVALGADAKSLDPHASNDQVSSRVNKQIYNTLVGVNEEMKLVPELAESWEAIDELTWEFELVQGVKFHNGEEVKASDVKFTIERMQTFAEVNHIVGPIDSVEIVDEYTVRIKTEEPFGPILAHLSHTASAILSEKAVTEGGEDYGQNPVGTGPFKFVEWNSGDSIKLAKFDDHFRGAAQIETIVFRPIVEATNRAIGLQTGDIDIAYDLEAVDKAAITNNKNLELLDNPSLSMAYIGFNLEKEPFDNPLVRKALNHAVDIDNIVEVVLEGAGQKAVSPLSELVFGYDEDSKGYEYNPEKAKELLKEAGYEDGFSTTLSLNNNPRRVKIAEILAAQLKDVGIDVSIQELEWSAYLDRTANGEHDMFILGWVAVTGDADYGLYALYHSGQHGSGGNRMFYTNERVDELLDIGKASTNQDERLEVYKEAQKLIIEDAPQIFTYFDNNNAGIKSNIEGFKLHPAGHHSLYSVSFK